MIHRKYNRIDGVWQEKTVAYIKEKGFTNPEIEWCITEKVHGSNFAIYIDQEETRFAKRSHFLKEGENFFQFPRAIDKILYKFQEMWDYIVSQHLQIEEMIIYGELCGGWYPHPEVKNVGSVRKIQKGVWYHPDIQYYIFDIMLNGEFIPHYLVCELCERFELLHAKILFRGTFDECMEYPNQFQTKIPEWLGIPLMNPNEKHTIKSMVGGYGLDEEAIYKEQIYYGNICEGFVLKPISIQRYEDGDRVILKSKNDIFKEISHEKSPQKARKERQELSEHALATWNLLEPYINENRLRNTLGNFGEFGKQDFRTIYDLFKEDIYEDFRVNHMNLEQLCPDDLKMLDKVVGKRVAEIWRPIYLREVRR